MTNPTPDPSSSLVQREPVAVAGGVQTVVAAALGVAAAFGVHVTDVQIAAILALTAAVLTLVVRPRVTPTK